MKFILTHSIVVIAFLAPQLSLSANTIAGQDYFTSLSAVANLSSITFIEDCPRKQKYCKGKREWDDGSSYEGEFKYGEPHGWGTFRWADGAIYIGEFRDGLRSGHGQQTFGNGDTFAGEWHLGFMHGKGVYDWVDGSKFVGTLVRGKMEGKGILTLPNGESYDGEWRNGLADGEGEYMTIDGSKHLGKYKHGKRHGSGIISWRTGDIFIGKWKNGNINKKGTFQFNNGDKYFCIWEDGEMTGEATYINVNGREIEGDPHSIQRAIEDDEELQEEIGPNLGLTWYAIALEYMELQNYNKAKENFQYAKKYVPASSELSKLIHDQLKIIEEKGDDSL